jgi:hypothetical protein
MQSSATDHVAEMVVYLGLPPLEYVRRSEITKKVFDDEGWLQHFHLITGLTNQDALGQWKGAGGTAIPQLSLKDAVSAFDGETKERFLNFVLSMLKWKPEKRKQASELLDDRWMIVAIP